LREPVRTLSKIFDVCPNAVVLKNLLARAAHFQ
jgi:hypothetical protein